MHKHRIYLSALSSATGETGLLGVTRASVTPEKRILKKKKYIKSLVLSPLRKDPIPNHDKKFMGINKYQYFTPDVPPFLTRNK